MPVPHTVARIVRRTLNPLIRPVAARVAPLAVIHHIGRTSGTAYHTPLMAFRTTGGFLIVLTYGPRTDWLRNLRAAGSANLVYGGKMYRISQPRLDHGDPRTQPLPGIVQAILRGLHVADYLTVTAEPRT